MRFWWLCLLWRVTGVIARLNCICSASECETVTESDCPAGAKAIWDPCGCCRVCERVENEPCGGAYGFSGTCADGLECVVTDYRTANAVGICTRVYGSDKSCSQPTVIYGCNIVGRECRCDQTETCAHETPFNFETHRECQLNLNSLKSKFSADTDDDEDCTAGDCVHCPPDSFLNSSNLCECSTNKCDHKCDSGYIQKLVRKGSGKPGDCCDIYDCIPNENKNCTNIICREPEPCPEDSYAFPAKKSMADDCCLSPQNCQCLPDNKCETPTCPVNQTLIIVTQATKTPGSCCPLYSCGQPPDVKSQDEVKGLRGCKTDADELVPNGFNWTNDDGCTSCTCANGQKICQATLCQACIKPIYVEKQCCPTCDDTHEQAPGCPSPPQCSQQCENGNVLDNNGCLTCQCQLENCALYCPDGYAENDSGDKLCQCANPVASCEPLKCSKKCVRGYMRDEKGCELCKCAECRPLDEFCSKRCPYGYLKDDEGCPMCRCKPYPKSSSAIDSKKVCKTESDTRDNGESWYDGCRECTCIAGKEMCSLIHCPTVDCVNPIVNLSTNCCPYCPENSDKILDHSHMVCMSLNNDILEDGDYWMLNDCTQCFCQNGRALCRTKDCPPTPCSTPAHPEKGKCCSVCRTSNEVSPFVDEEGDDIRCTSSLTNSTAWREGACTSCHCRNGKVRCYTELCPQSRCKHPVFVKGKCCPVCVDTYLKTSKETEDCVYENATMKSGTEWSVDACTRCSCIAGRTQCTQKICSQSCPNAVKKPGKCCPACSEENPSPEFSVMQEICYIILLLIFVCISIALLVYVTRQWRYKKQQIRFHDFDRPPPQYQYKCILSNTYDSSSQKVPSDKVSLALV